MLLFSLVIAVAPSSRSRSEPESVAVSGTTSQRDAALIGIVRSYLSYEDYAISRQTKQVRVVFQENSGLAEVLPTDYIEEAVKAWRSANGKPPVR